MITIADDKAADIAETMARTIDSMDLMDLYNSVEYDDPVEGIKDAIKTFPFVVIDFLANHIEEMEWDRRNKR